MGPSVSQIAVASPFCRALKIFLVEEWNKLGLLRILLLARFLPETCLRLKSPDSRLVTLPRLGAQHCSTAFPFPFIENRKSEKCPLELVQLNRHNTFRLYFN
jgi:hypothetical protein